MPMKDSKLTDAWITKMVQANPMTVLPNGNIRTCPVRLAFTALFEPKKPGKNDAGADKPPTWGAALLFPPGAEAGINGVLFPAWVQGCREKFPKNIGADGRPFGLHWPVHPCAEKQNLPGYTPGLYYLDVSSRFKPDVVDPALNPITDPERGYSGVWAICILRTYSYDNLKRGVGFGLAGVMLIAEDEKLYKPGIDAPAAFSGVSIDQAYDPGQQFGAAPGFGMPPAAAAAPSIMPPAASVYTPPPSFAPPPALRTEDLI